LRRVILEYLRSNYVWLGVNEVEGVVVGKNKVRGVGL